jgi:hypothetical protein
METDEKMDEEIDDRNGVEAKDIDIEVEAWQITPIE